MAKHWSTKPLNQGWPSSMFILCFQFSNAPTFSLRARLAVNVADEEGQEAVKLLLGLGAALSRISKSWGQTARQPPSPQAQVVKKCWVANQWPNITPKNKPVNHEEVLTNTVLMFLKKSWCSWPKKATSWFSVAKTMPFAPSPVTVSDQYWSIVLWSSQGLP